MALIESGLNDLDASVRVTFNGEWEPGGPDTEPGLTFRALDGNNSLGIRLRFADGKFGMWRTFDGTDGG